MVARRYVLLALALFAILASGTLGGLALAQFALSGVNPFYWNAPLPGPLVAAPEPGPVVETPPAPVVLPAAWSDVDRFDPRDAGFDPGPPETEPDPPPLPDPTPLIVDKPRVAATPAAAPPIAAPAPAPAEPVQAATPAAD